ncbi:hypothetical protein EV360DRAFT_89561 [Lentinula raphanica]|nr:hypothetical protein EV360DRAFT_89561 [Lentinula raphanica]
MQVIERPSPNSRSRVSRDQAGGVFLPSFFNNPSNETGLEAQWHKSVNQTGRELLHNALGSASMFEVMSRKPVSNKQLLLFEQDPDHHGRSLTATALDTSHGTALEMNAFFKNYIYRVLVHIERERAEEGVAQVTHHDDSGDDESQVQTDPMRQSRIRTDMSMMKLKRWFNLCSVMIRVCREQQDTHGVSVWSDIMLFVSEHCFEGTSEEEDDNNAAPPHARLVKYIVLGHPKSRGNSGVDNGMQDREKFEFRNSGPVDCLHRTQD